MGGKGGSLGELMRAGIPVPPGFVLKTSAFERFMKAFEAQSAARSRVESLDPGNLPAIASLSAELRRSFTETPLPAEVADAIAEAHATLCGTVNQLPLAVRSSATTEDAVDASFAGLQDTYLWVKGLEDTQDRVRDCWGSLYSVESISYRRKRGFKEADVAMAVVVQAMVDARTAGVMFTRSPITGDRSVMTIEGAWGLGSAVVGGEVTPDRWVVGKITGEISVRELSAKLIRHAPGTSGIQTVDVAEELQRAACLSDEEIQSLRAIGRRVERHYGRAQDIEWAVVNGSEEIVLLQSRPETVWSAKESAPVGRAASDPSSHVLSIFGGRR